MPSRHGMPDFVVEEALLRGAHNDCFMHDALPCEACGVLVIEVLDQHYGQITLTSDMIRAILEDMK